MLRIRTNLLLQINVKKSVSDSAQELINFFYSRNDCWPTIKI